MVSHFFWKLSYKRGRLIASLKVLNWAFWVTLELWITQVQNWLRHVLVIVLKLVHALDHLKVIRWLREIRKRLRKVLVLLVSIRSRLLNLPWWKHKLLLILWEALVLLHILVILCIILRCFWRCEFNTFHFSFFIYLWALIVCLKWIVHFLNFFEFKILNLISIVTI